MTVIRCIYQAEPAFPALDQHPAAVRYQVGGYWVDAVGGAPTLAEVEALLGIGVQVVPPEVTMRQARLALAEAGLLPQVDALIAAMAEPDRTNAAIEWEYSGSVRRTQPLVLQLAPAMGLTDAQLDQLFRRAAQL